MSTRPFEPTVLAVDLGGTKTSLALYPLAAGGNCTRRLDYPSRDHRSLDDILDAFLGSAELPVAACLGVAGPVRDGHSAITNLPWEVDEREVARRLRCPVELVNDLVTLADGLGETPARDLEVLHPGSAAPGAALLVAVGTGLGVSILAPLPGGERTALPSEGGHVTLAARDAHDARVIEAMRLRKHGRCDAEAVLSGSALPDLYECLRPEATALGVIESVASTRAVRESGGKALFAAAEGGDSYATFVIERWLSWFGSQVGDYALVSLPFAGIYLAGGVLQKNVGWLRRPGFRAGFLAKSGFREVLGLLPISVVTSPDTALRGAARRARRLATSPSAPGGRASGWSAAGRESGRP